MFSILISVYLALVSSLFAYSKEISTVWSVTIGVASFLLFQILISLYLRKKMTLISENIQKVIIDGQNAINRKVKRFQQKPSGNIKVIQRQIEKEQKILLKKAIAMTSNLEPYYKWSFMVNKQVNTMRMQFYFQMKDYAQVDKLLPKTFLMEPLSYAMKMTREYAHKDYDSLEKTYEKGIKKFKKEKGVIIFALYSWTLVKRKNIEKAIEVLSKGKEETTNELLVKNWEYLSNNRIKQFSNAMLGEQWYSLNLEEYKQKPVKVKGKRAKFY